MKKTLRTLGLCALAALTIVSCKKNDEKVATTSFEATITQPNSDAKTHIGDGNWLMWNTGDAIKVFDGNGTAATFTTTDNNKKVANFEGEIEASDRYCAFYPAGSTSDASAGSVTLTLAATQTYANGSFSTNTYPMTAVNNGNSFTFSSPCGMLAIPVKGTGTLGSIELTGKNDEQLAGTYAFNLANMTNEFTGNATTVILNCEGGLTLDSETAATMLFVLPVGTLSNGFTAVLKGTNGAELYRLETASDNTVAADMIRLMPEVTVNAIAVTTAQASNVVYTTATLNGSYEAPTGMTITEVGFYWGNATALNNKVTADLGSTFTYDLEGLEEGMEYAYQAYAKNGETEYTGCVMTFETGVSVVLPTVTTAAATDVESTTTTVGGSITSDGGGTISAYGISYSTTDGFEGTDGTPVEGTDLSEGSFTINLTQLSGKTTYYARAYATNEAGTAYGEQVSFTTLQEGIVNSKAKFTVNSEGDQVYFSKGNLQYIGSAATPYWKFAESQYEYLGTTTGQNSNSETVDRDLFGYGTSGYDNGQVYWQPYNTNAVSGNNIYYGENLEGNADWGYNAIINGGNQEDLWHTLSSNEWLWIIDRRITTSGIRYAKATVNGIGGLILLPDDWDADSYNLINTNTPGAEFSSNNITADIWVNHLESEGAVFLPAAGYRSNTTVYELGVRGNYWSKSKSIALISNASVYSVSGSNYSWGNSVRLVCPVE